MEAAASSNDLDYRWAPITALSGTAGVIAYTMIGILDHSASNAIVVPLAFLFAFGITASSIGLYHILGGAKRSPLVLIAAAANVIAPALLFAMIMVQASVYAVVDQPDAALKAVWWGLDVAWDLYIGTGTILFALCMFGRPGLGAWFAVPGLLIAVPFLIFNIATFPKPPDIAGLVDLGPVIGLWYLVVYVRVGISAALQQRRQRRSSASLEGLAG